MDLKESAFLLTAVYIAIFLIANLFFYWLQLRNESLTRLFGKKAFRIWFSFDILLMAVTIIMVILFIFYYPQPEMFSYGIFLRIVGLLMVILGAYLSLITSKQIGFLRSFSQSIFTRKKYELERKGAFRYLKHPMYLGSFLIFIGATVLINSFYMLVFTIECGVYFIIRSKLEEKELALL